MNRFRLGMQTKKTLLLFSLPNAVQLNELCWIDSSIGISFMGILIAPQMELASPKGAT